MGIPAIRFKAFDTDTNIGIADFTNIQTNDIFTSPNNKLKLATDELKSLLNTANQGIKLPSSKLLSASDNLTRSTKDIFSTFKDVTGLSPSRVEGMISSMLPNNSSLQNAFKMLSTACRDRGLGSRSNTKPIKNRFKCGSNNGACDPGNIGGLLDSATGGLFSTATGAISSATNGINSMTGLGKSITNAVTNAAKALNNGLQAILSLSSMGYEAGLCKVFQTLGTGMPNSIMSRASATLIGQESAKQNTKAVIDIAGQSSGLFPLMENPGAIRQAVTGFKLPDLPVNGLSSFGTGFMGGMEILKDNWMKSADGKMPSLSNMGTTFNEDWSKTLETKATEGYVDPTKLGEVTVNNSAMLSGAYKLTTGGGSATTLDAWDQVEVA